MDTITTYLLAKDRQRELHELADTLAARKQATRAKRTSRRSPN